MLGCQAMMLIVRSCMFNKLLPCIAEHVQQCFMSSLHGNDADLLATSVCMSVCVKHEDEYYPLCSPDNVMIPDLCI